MGNDFTGEAAGDLGDDLVGLLDTTYCTVTELRRYLSAQGVTDFADHNQDGAADSQVVADSINWATQEIDMLALMRYSVTGLTGSNIIGKWCIVMSAYFLCQRRANPVPNSILNEFERITGMPDGLLTKISDGRMQLPGVPLRADLSPSFSNLTVDRRWPHSTIRVTRENSSDSPTELTQDVHRHHHRGIG
jgi:phage gp36-like protein